MNHLLFPQPISMDGYQTLLGSCSDVEKLRVSHGNLVRQYTVASVATVGPALNFMLTHNSCDDYLGVMGPNWRHNWMANLEIDTLLVTYVDAQGRRHNFTKPGSDWVLDQSNSLFLQKTLTEDSGEWHLKGFGNGDDMIFNSSGKLSRIVDSHSQTLTLHYAGDDLTSVEEETGRELTFTYASDLLHTVSDPNGNVTTFLYNGDSKLVSIVGPEGCQLSYLYASGSTNGLITSRTDARNNTYTYSYDGSQRLLTVTNPASEVLTYVYDTVNEMLSSPYDIEYKTLPRTRLTDAEAHSWDYRFDDYGNLWRVLDPFGHNRRMYWSDQQDLLYVSEGYGVNLRGDLGPKDSPYNRYTHFTYDGLGNQIASVDANGIITQTEYDGDNRVVTVTPARATNNIGGNWFDHFGSDGFVMCSALDDSSDLVQLPSYIDSGGILAGEELDDSNPFVRALPDSVIHRLDTRAPWIRLPGSPVRDTYRRTLGMWKPEEEGSSFTFRIPVSETGEFNLSFYTHSADQEYFDELTQYYEQCYAGSFGRDVEFLITDFDPISGDPRRQVFRLPNNAAGCWVTFGVYAQAESSIRVLVRSRAEVSETEFPVINCIAFDPIEQRTTNLYYTGVDLTSVVNPLNQATVMEYNGDGTLSKVTDAKSRDTLFFYEDDFKNLTKITDAALGDVILEYDDNGNVVSSQDQDTRTSLMEYDGKNRLVKVTDPLNHSTEFFFDPAGNLIEIKDAKGRTTILSYNNLNRLVRVSNALSQETYFEYNATGRLTKVTDALGRETNFVYDAAGRLVETQLADEQRILYALNAVNRLVSISGPNASQEAWDEIRLTGALNVLDNANMEQGDANNYPLRWLHKDDNEFNGTVYPRSSAQAHSGTYSLIANSGKGFRQLDITTYAGGRYLAKAWAKKASGGASTVTASIEADVRNFTSALETQTDAGQTVAVDTNWTEFAPQIVQIPGDTQALRTLPALASFRLKVDKTSPGDTTTAAYLDDASLQLINTCMEYDGENLREVGTADGARFRREFDRVGRLCRLSDPQGRVIFMNYDSLDRVVSVSDSLGLTLAYSYDETGQLSSFTDAKNQVMTFAYDELDRLLTITYPDTSTEEFAYSPAGDLESYTDNNAQERTFDYDLAHRLVGVTYPNTDTLVLVYDELNNLISRTERNGDVEAYHYDRLNRVTRCVFTPDVGSDSAGWDLTSLYDAVGNRTELAVTGGTTAAFYGAAHYGTDHYGESSPIWSVPEEGFDAMNRLVEFKDSQDNSTTFAYDIEGRRTGVSSPNGTLTKATYDIVGKLLSLRTTLEEQELLKLDYGYNLASDRLALQTDKAAYTYHLDKSGRLVEETINRWVTQHTEHLAQGEMAHCQLDFENRRVQLLSIADDFSQLNVDRWKPSLQTYTPYFQPWEKRFLGNELRAKQGLHMVYPSAWTAFDYPLGKDNAGYSMGPPIRSRIGFRATPAVQELRLRTPLVGDFDLVLEWEDSMGAPDGIVSSNTRFNAYPNKAFLQMTVQKLDGTAGCYVSRAYNSNPADHPYPADNNHYRGKYDNDGTIYVPTTSDTVGKLRIKRSSSNLDVYYWNEAGPAWVRVGPGRTSYNTDPLQLVLTGQCEHGCMNYTLLSLTHNDEDPALFAEEGTYESSLFDAGQTCQWERISWDENLETGTDVEFQVAFSNDVSGPWSYIGPDGTSGTVFTTPAGEDFDATSDFEGRYARFKVTLTGDGMETPSFGGVHLSFSGEGLLESRVQNYQYDEAGNITMVTTVTDAGSATDERTLNDLNQITEQAVGGDTWTFSYDDNGNMTGKTDGTDTWTYSWNDENRLVRVQGPGSVDVSYSYDSMGRMLTRDDGGPDITQLVWDGWDIVKEVTGESETVYHIPDGQIISFIRDGVTYQAHSDALGSIRMITDEEGEVVARYEYSAFGQAISVTEDPALTDFAMMFIGSLAVRTDVKTGLNLMLQRWYDPTIQRFISRDPIGLSGGANLYEYAENNPLNLSDPQGLEPWTSKSKVRTAPDGHTFTALEFLMRKMPAKSREALMDAFKNATAKRIKAGAKRRGPKDYEPSYNCFGNALEDQLGGKFFVDFDEAGRLFKLYFDPVVDGKARKGDVILYIDSTNVLDHAIKVLDVDSKGKATRVSSKNGMEAVFEGTPSQSNDFGEKPKEKFQLMRPKK